MATSKQKTGYTADNVAKYFIYLASRIVGDNEEKEGVSNLKLQKILYLAQAYFVAKIGKPLFGDRIEAWEYGPVVPSVYRKYRSHGSGPIVAEEDESSVTDEDKEILSRVWESFGGFSAGRLVDITHAHIPWKEAYAEGGGEISLKSLEKYYGPLLNK